MPASLKRSVAFMVVSVLIGLLAGCSAPKRTTAVESPSAAPEPAAATATEPTPAAVDEPTSPQETPETQAADAAEKERKEREEKEKKAKEEAKQAKERQRKLAHLERELKTATLRLDNTRLGNEHAEIKFAESLEQATIQLELAREKYVTTQEIEVPRRIAWSELNLQRSRDNLQNATEELEQLELMYKDDQFADQTKEIVIDRARRSLERTQRDVRLREEEHAKLLEVYLPREKREQELQLAKQERDLARMQRDEQRATIDRQIRLLGAEAAIIKLEQQLEDLHEEIKEAEEKKAEEEKKAAEDQAG